MAMLDQIARKLTELGFTQYEAKAYVCLLQNCPATRYEISKKSGVPRSAIYDVVRRLEEHGVVNAISSKPEKYMPLPPDKFTELLENNYKHKLEEFQADVSDLQVDIEMENLWNISGYENMIVKAKEMIMSAKDQIYISGWRREIVQFESELRDAEARGVKVVQFSFTDLPRIGHVFSYGLNEKEMSKVWDHKIILVRDLEELLMGEANDRYSRNVAWTHNKAIVMIAVNHVVLDIVLYGLRLNEDIGAAVIETHPGELELLDRLLKEKYPNQPWINLNFNQNHPEIKAIQPEDS